MRQCSREGCEAIMCDRLSQKHGYICNECFWLLVHSQSDVDSFMRSDATQPRPDAAYFKKIFPQI